jgi:histone deacetylase 1/2
MSTSQLQLSTIGPLAASSSSMVPAGIAASIPVHLDRGNFMLWKGLTLPNLSGADLHGHLNELVVTPEKTITEGEGDKAVVIPNPAYHRWWIQDQKVLGLLLSSMEPEIACQLIGCNTAADVWTSVHTLFGAQSRANVRHICRQLQTLRKEELTAGEYMHKMKALADIMAAAGAPVSNDELVDYIITGLGSAYRAIAVSLTLNNRSVPYAEFYSSVLSFEALEAQQAQAEEWSSSANAVSRPASYGNPSRPHMQEYNPAPQGGYQGGNRTYGNGGQQGHNRTGGNGGYARNGGYGSNGGNGRNNGNNGRNGGNRRRWRKRCQLCGNWGHEAIDCRNRFDPDYHPDNYHSGNSASTSSNNNNHHNPPWYLDTGATDHLTSDLERLHVHERY